MARGKAFAGSFCIKKRSTPGEKPKPSLEVNLDGDQIGRDPVGEVNFYGSRSEKTMAGRSR